MSLKIISKRQLRRRISNNTKNAIQNIINEEYAASSSATEHIKINNNNFHLNLIELENISNSDENVMIIDDNEIDDRDVNEYYYVPNNQNISTDNKDFEYNIHDKVSQENEGRLKLNGQQISQKIEEQAFVSSFKKWACQNNVTHKCCNEIISLIRPKYPFLKKDIRSILGTPRKVETKILENGELIYFSIKAGLTKKIDSKIIENTLISVQINIDGIPLYNNSTIEFWPILAKIKNDKTPFVVAIFCGKGKPTPIESFLSDFIEESNELRDSGFKYNNILYQFNISLFTCDAPARSYLKNIKGHTSKLGCERCTQNSLCSEKRRYYDVNDITSTKRKDSDFENPELRKFDKNKPRKYDHIKGSSPLIKLNLGLVSQFVLDPMHLLYLGVTKRMLVKYLVEGKRRIRLSKTAIGNINRQIKNLKFPEEFTRTLRTLQDVKRWKAVEFRMFLLYYGPILLKNNITKAIYEHFLYYHAAVFILSNNYFVENYLDIAQSALTAFVYKSAEIYSKFFVVYNVHSLIHLCEDARKYGNIENYSCFDYENYLGKLKRSVRGKHRPLQQIYNRICEMDNSDGSNNRLQKIKEHVKGVYSEENGYFQCKKYYNDRFVLSFKKPNNVVAVGKKIFTIKSIYFLNGAYWCSGVPFKYMYNFYEKPIESSKLNIYFAKGRGKVENFTISSIMFKCIATEYKDGFTIFPILHTTCAPVC